MIYVPEEKKFFESRHVRCAERFVYKDFYESQNKIKIDNSIVLFGNGEESIQLNAQPSSETEGEIVEPAEKRLKTEKDKNTEENIVLFSLNEKFSNALNTQEDIAYHALLAKIQGDPQTYREAMSSSESQNWFKQ